MYHTERGERELIFFGVSHREGGERERELIYFGLSHREGERERERECI